MYLAWDGWSDQISRLVFCRVNRRHDQIFTLSNCDIAHRIMAINLYRLKHSLCSRNLNILLNPRHIHSTTHSDIMFSRIERAFYQRSWRYKPQWRYAQKEFSRRERVSQSSLVCTVLRAPTVHCWPFYARWLAAMVVDGLHVRRVNFQPHSVDGA